MPYDKEPYLLFIGSVTAANIEAAKIIMIEISPYINMKCVIAGSGMDKFFTDYDKTKISVVGYVEDFAELLNGVCAFICLIYHGSGSKIKIAEAMMFGKNILATSQSFNGYDMNGLVYSVCNKLKDFINEINKLNVGKKYYEENRNRFMEKYSDTKLEQYYRQIFDFIEDK